MTKGKNKNAIRIFTRFPEAGKVKTRLAESIGDDASCQIHKIIAERIFSECLKLDKNIYSLFVFYPDENNKLHVRDWIDRRFSLFTQKGKTLGEKMSIAFQKAFELGFDNVIIIGTDIPDISNSTLSNAFLELEIKDIVIGPSNDGGYYLLGMKKILPELFDGMGWSTKSFFEKTVQ